MRAACSTLRRSAWVTSGVSGVPARSIAMKAGPSAVNPIRSTRPGRNPVTDATIAAHRSSGAISARTPS
jgi:hypothetical protein